MELIKVRQIEIDKTVVNSVNSRDLHKGLEVKKDYSNWIKDQVKSLDLEENFDYIVFAQKGENPKGGRPEIDYILTLDAAKHISMASRTKKGKEVRKYFIEIEKKYITNFQDEIVKNIEINFLNFVEDIDLDKKESLLKSFAVYAKSFLNISDAFIESAATKTDIEVLEKMIEMGRDKARILKDMSKQIDSFEDRKIKIC